jgi:type 1 glutamine amidotransferase
MTFKLNLAIFKSTKPDSKVDFSGRMNIKPEELDAFCAFVMSQTPDQYGSVQVPVTGWKKQSGSGVAYVSAVAQPPRDWVPPATAQSAAASLAQATDGVVTEITEADLF